MSDFYFRENESPHEYENRLQLQREYHHNLDEDQRENKLANMREYSQNSRDTESNLRRSTRLEAKRSNERRRQAAKSAKDREKDAHEKWKKRYKK